MVTRERRTPIRLYAHHPIPGTTKVYRLKENVGAAAIELNDDGLRQIEGALSTIKVQGDRYPPHLAARAGK